MDEEELTKLMFEIKMDSLRNEATRNGQWGLALEITLRKAVMLINLQTKE